MNDRLDDRSPADPWAEEIAAEWLGEGLSPAEWAARHAHALAMCSFLNSRFRDPTLDAWIVELDQILRAPDAVDAARRRYLTRQELKAIEEREHEPF
jgi:hypothetical protein